MDPFPGAIVTPRGEVVADRLPRREVVREHPPSAATASQIEARVDDFPERIRAGPTGGPIPLRELVLNVIPLEVGEITRVAHPCGGVHAQRVTTTLPSAKAQFLDGQLAVLEIPLVKA